MSQINHWNATYQPDEAILVIEADHPNAGPLRFEYDGSNLTTDVDGSEIDWPGDDDHPAHPSLTKRGLGQARFWIPRHMHRTWDAIQREDLSEVSPYVLGVYRKSHGTVRHGAIRDRRGGGSLQVGDQKVTASGYRPSGNAHNVTEEGGIDMEVTSVEDTDPDDANKSSNPRMDYLVSLKVPARSPEDTILGWIENGSVDEDRSKAHTLADRTSRDFSDWLALLIMKWAHFGPDTYSAGYSRWRQQIADLLSEEAFGMD
jgi:hypothetical protein